MVEPEPEFVEPELPDPEFAEPELPEPAELEFAEPGFELFGAVAPEVPLLDAESPDAPGMVPHGDMLWFDPGVVFGFTVDGVVLFPGVG